MGCAALAYPLSDKYTGAAALVDPTEEELDRLIEEQRKNLPAWWHSSGENMNRRRGK